MSFPPISRYGYCKSVCFYLLSIISGKFLRIDIEKANLSVWFAFLIFEYDFFKIFSQKETATPDLSRIAEYNLKYIIKLLDNCSNTSRFYCTSTITDFGFVIFDYLKLICAVLLSKVAYFC